MDQKWEHNIAFCVKIKKNILPKSHPCKYCSHFLPNFDEWLKKRAKWKWRPFIKKSCEIRLKSWAPVFYNHYWSCFLQTIDLVLSMKEILKLLISESKVEYQMWNQKVSSVWSQFEIHRKNWRNAGAERECYASNFFWRTFLAIPLDGWTVNASWLLCHHNESR